MGLPLQVFTLKEHGWTYRLRKEGKMWIIETVDGDKRERIAKTKGTYDTAREVVRWHIKKRLHIKTYY